jgi:hypothetical protein
MTPSVNHCNRSEYYIRKGMYSVPVARKTEKRQETANVVDYKVSWAVLQQRAYG